MPESATSPKKRSRKKKDKREEHDEISLFSNAISYQASQKYPQKDGSPSVKFLFKYGDGYRFRVDWVKAGLIVFSIYVIACQKDDDSIECKTTFLTNVQNPAS